MDDERFLDPSGTARCALEGEGLLPRALVRAAAELDVDEAQLALGTELARLLPPGIDRGAFAALAAVSRLAHQRGSTRVPLSGPLLEAHLRDLDVDPAPVLSLAARLEETPELGAPVVARCEGHAPLLVESGHLYPQRMFALEARVATRVRLRSEPAQAAEDVRIASKADLERALGDVRAHPPRVGRALVRLSDEQADAVGVACRSPLTLISGGPGTGKTSIVVSILRALVRLGEEPERIALAAPTGKAADRMRRSIEATLQCLDAPGLEDVALLRDCPESRTLHRLLGYQPRARRYRHHEQDPLRERVVIVDESSMIDLAMVDRLLGALAPDARLVLLGDAEQLPSVDAGAVFRDLCASLAGTPAVVRLTKSYRMDPKDPAGRHVLTIAQSVHAGETRHLFGRGRIRRRSGVERLAFEGVEHLEASELPALLRSWRERHAELPQAAFVRTYRSREGAFDVGDEAILTELFARMERARILCLTRGRRTGVEAINRTFHDQAIRDAKLSAALRIAVGEPVLVTRNDYDRGLFNGDQGIVLFVAGERGAPRPSAVFRRREGFVAFPLDAIASALELAYAVTVHKAQGSEHEVVAVVLPEEPIPLLTREMLYTAMTRARRSVVLVGDRELLRHGVEARVRRSSGLAERLRSVSPQEEPGRLD